MQRKADLLQCRHEILHLRSGEVNALVECLRFQGSEIQSLERNVMKCGSPKIGYPQIQWFVIMFPMKIASFINFGAGMGWDIRHVYPFLDKPVWHRVATEQHSTAAA